MRLLCRYLRDKLGVLMLLGGCVAIFATVYFLAGTNEVAARYAGVLCIALIAFAAMVDFVQYALARRRYVALIQSGLVDISSLPLPQNQAEREYHGLLAIVFEDKQRLLCQFEQQEQDALDYYTLWAHQIKSPISAMRLLLQDGELSASSLDMELFKIERYVEMVLSYQQLGQFGDLVIRPCSLEDMARQSVRKYAPQFVQKRLSLDFGRLTGDVLTDEKWFCFVLNQVLSNALKYTPAGTIRIFQPDSGTLVIEDTGIGIAPEDLPRVCEKSYTGANGRMDKRATGIGLYLCKEICNRLGHGLWLESTLGVGTRVCISLKRAKVGIE